MSIVWTETSNNCTPHHLISGSTMHKLQLSKVAESFTCEKPGEEVPEGGEVCGRMRPAHQQHQALAHRRTIYTPKSVLIPRGPHRDVVHLS
jgi:hypothetical protein